MRHVKSSKPNPTRAAAAPAWRRNYARWRAATLTFVYIFFIAHITHWLVAGRTLAPLELNEVMTTFELGIITAGFLFMALAFVATAVFGRFFCSWGCHILALQDLCGWLLGKLGIRPRAVRSRALVWIPMAATLYMFVWPQIQRIWLGRPLPPLRIAGDVEGWASFVTENFWRNLPGPGIIALTFALCGFLIVWLLGSRGFCTYGCPYGVLFGLADRVAPGRIRATPGRSCEGCGVCTAACGSHIRVHEEIARHGMIVNAACLKDLDCVAACPDGGLRYGWGRPSLFKTVLQNTRISRRFDFTLAEEVLMLLVFVAVLVIFRGLYDVVPFLMTLGLGICVAYVCVVALRLTRQPFVALNRWCLKHSGRFTSAGRAFVGVTGVFLAFTVHSAFIQYHVFQGRRLSENTVAALHHLELAERWGLTLGMPTSRMMADLYARDGRWADAERHFKRGARALPEDAGVRFGLAKALARQKRLAEALDEGRAAARLPVAQPEAHYALAGLFFELGARDDAKAQLVEATRLRPEWAEAQYELGALFLEQGDTPEGIRCLRQAVALKPEFAEAHYNLAVALAMAGQYEEALREADQALALHPDDVQTAALRDRLQTMTRR